MMVVLRRRPKDLKAARRKQASKQVGGHRTACNEGYAVKGKGFAPSALDR